MKVAYFVNHYPKVSHSFIRREIMALERLGLPIERFALRGWDGELVDPEDRRELTKTRFVLQGGLPRLMAALMTLFLVRPRALIRGLGLTWELARGGDRTFAHHLVALAEAALLTKWLRSAGIDHVHAHFGTNSAEVVMLANALGGPPYSFTAHGPEEWDHPRELKIREKVRDAAFVVGISSFARAQLARWVDPQDLKKIHEVHCALEKEFHDVAFAPVPDNCRLVCVGRLSREKAQLLLVQAVGLLRQRGVELELVLAGDGEARADVEQLIAQYQLQQSVRVTGWISADQVRNEILAARALVLPSCAEGLPVVLMEAMALRRPVLSTYVGGIPELVRTGVDGWLFPAGSIEALSQAIEACLTTPIDRLRQMGDAAHERVLERHSVDTEAAKLLRLFERN